MKNHKISSALKISLVYALLGGIWILLSDQVVSILFTSPEQLSIIQTYKGWFYVGVTAIILFILIKSQKNTLTIAEQSFSDLFESTTEGIFRSSPEGRFISVNAAMAKIFGYISPEEMIETITSISTQIHLSADSRRKFIEILTRNGTVEKFEARNLKKDGDIIWTSTNARAVKDKHGNVLYYEGFVTNITKQKKAESSLIDAEKRYRTLVEKLPAVVFMDKFKQPQSTQYISPRLEELLGYTPEEWTAGNSLWEDSLHPDDKERVIAEDIRTDESGEPFRIEYRLRHRDGHYVWIKEDASLIRGEDGAPLFWQGILLDITDQKHTEAALQRRDEIIKAVGVSAEQFLKSSKWEDCISQVLNQLGKATQVSRVYVVKKQVTPDNVIMASQVFEWCNDGIKPQINNENLQNSDLAADGFSRWIELFNKGLPVYGLIKNFPNEEQFFLGKQDILALICIPLQSGKDWWGFIGFDECTMEREWTESEIEALKAASNTLSAAINKKLSEEALLNSEASYRGLFNSIHDTIHIQDINGVFLDANDGAEQMYGYPKEYFIGKTPDMFEAPGKNDMNKVTQAIQHAFNGETQQFEFWGKRSNGEIFPKDVRLFKGIYFGQDVVIAISQDITERKHYEDDLQKQLKELTILHSAALAESTATSVDDLLQQVTDIIGNTLYTDNCGVLLLNETQDKIKPHFSYRGTSKENLTLSTPLAKGITGKVASTGKSICAGNVFLEPSYYEGTAGILSELCVPIGRENKIIGVLNVESKQPNAFTRTDERLLNTIASGMAKAIERIQLFETEQKRRKQAEILRETTGKLSSFFEMDKLFENIFASLAKLIGYDSASIEVVNQGYFEIVAGQNIPQEMIGQKYIADTTRWGDISSLRQPIIIPDVQQDVRFEKFPQTNYIHGWMGIPLFAKDKIIGFLNLDSRTSGFFNEEYAAIAQTFANQAATAIENARLFALEHHRRSQAEILSQATSALANTLDINSLYENILDWLEKIAPYDSASIMLNNGETEKLAAKRNLPEHFHIGQTFPITEKWKQVAATRKPFIIEDAQSNKYFEKWEGSAYIHGWMCIAMYTQDKLIGFLNLDSKTAGIYTEEHGILAQTFANQAATAIENARLFELEQKRRKEAEIVRQATTVLTTLLDLPALHEAILEWLYKITPYNSASILELEGNRIRITAAKGLPSPEKALNQTFPADNILCSTISETREPLIIEDCEKDPRFEKWGDTQNVRGWMGVPMISRGQVIGYITLDSYTPNAFTQNDAVAAQTFAHQAATSLENSRLFTETKQRLDELEVVSRVSFALRAAHDTQEMLPILLDEIKASVGTDSAAIWLYEIEHNELKAKATAGWFNNLPKPNFKPNKGIVGVVYSSGATHTTTSEVGLENENFFGENGSGIAVPIRTATETIGVLAVALNAPHKVKSHQIRLVTTLAEITGNAIYRSTLYERSEKQIQRLTTLRELDTAITSSLDLRIPLNILTEHLLAKMEVSAATVLVFNPESQTLDYFAAAGFKNRTQIHAPLNIGDGLAGQILISRKAVFIKDLTEEASPLQIKLLKSEGFKSYYAIPLFSKGATRGVLETYFRQSFSPSADWIEFLHTLAEQAIIAIDNAQLFENLQHSNQELSLAYDTTLEGWGKALELRDKETEGHTRRVTNLTLELARQMGIPQTELLQIRRGTLLHDIGKMGVSDNILHKAGPLTDEERTEMHKHPQYAYDMLYPIAYLRPALDIVYCHHEWWNGNGYPRGLKGEEIPLSARIFAIIDVWDALSSDRPYRKAWDNEKIIEYIRGLSGKQFDPQIVDVFFKMIESKWEVESGK
jgi:PAS domain S-box-containing protein/putative nucleotidyltransferase with HDIG domain